MAKCRATARRTGERCANTAGADGACDIAAHKKQVAELSAEIAGTITGDPTASVSGSIEVPAPDWDSPGKNEPAPVAPAAERSRLEALIADLPIADDTIPAELGAASRGVIDRSVFDDLDDEDDAQTIDREAAADVRQEIISNMRARKPVSLDRIAFYIRIAHNPVFEASGEEPLSAEESREGAEIVHEILEDMRGTWVVENPWARLATWAAWVWGVRYFDRLIEFARDSIKAKRKPAAVLDFPRGAAAPAAAAPAAPEAAPVSYAGAGFS